MNASSAASAPKIGVLLINLGTPDAPEPAPVRRYLKEFLSDQRVVELPKILWQPILRGAVLTTRPKKSAHAYGLVWTDEGSPLAAVTRRQTKALQPLLGDEVRVDYAMRYGNPSIPSVMDALIASGCERILIAPLYPQYSAATTATVVDAVGCHLASLRAQPTVRFLPPYYDAPAHIAALGDNLRAGLSALPFTPDILLASYHGMPQRTADLGDPYYHQCLKTSELLSEQLGRPVETAFQSRFGKAKWIGPATDAQLETWGREGKSVAIFAPGFSADCIETLEELAIRGKESFTEAGGKEFAYLPCLNDDAYGMAMLEELIRQELAGWIKPTI
jgi:ferrochelatase